MGHWYNPPPPQPAAVHVPPNATAAANIPPNPVGPGSPLIRSIWPQESWPSQILTGGGVGALTASVFTPPTSIAAVNPALLAVIHQAWPSEAWPAQRAAQIASLFATTPAVPVSYPSPSPSLAVTRGLWPPESWYAQSEAGIASGIAQIQQPPLYQPWSTVSRMALLRSMWLPEDWPAQASARYASLIPAPVTPLPTAIRHLEILLWTPDTWPAQSGTRNARILAGAPSTTPYQNRWLAAAIRSTWLPETWSAQTFPDIIAGTPTSAPPLPRPPSQFTISLWPVEFWGAQAGTRAAALFATPQLLLFMPEVRGELEFIAVAQLQSLFQPVITLQYVFSGAPPLTVVAQSIPKGTLVFPGEAVTLQISLGIQHGPAPCPIVRSILISNIPVVVSILPPNKPVIQ
jgi:hypothetical protein